MGFATLAAIHWGNGLSRVPFQSKSKEDLSRFGARVRCCHNCDLSFFEKKQRCKRNSAKIEALSNLEQCNGSFHAEQHNGAKVRTGSAAAINSGGNHDYCFVGNNRFGRIKKWLRSHRSVKSGVKTQNVS